MNTLAREGRAHVHYFTSDEIRRLEWLIEVCRGDTKRAAKLLGVSRTSFYRLLFGGKCWSRTVSVARTEMRRLGAPLTHEHAGLH